ncbi:MAG: precorrin-6Y C5,15-methyltransferase (decarboxylating) subunit CbiT [Bacillota bacterium]
MNPWPYETPGIPDRLFAKDGCPMTREEIRALVIAKLQLAKSQVVWDIGAGAGSVAVEAGRIVGSGRVFAVEAKPERKALIEENAAKFGLSNIEAIQGTAPEVFNALPPADRVFIGGSGGRLPSIIERLVSKLQPGGRIVMTAVTLETLTQAGRIFEQPPFDSFEGLAVSLGALRVLGGSHLLQPEHAIYILAANIH